MQFKKKKKGKQAAAHTCAGLPINSLVLELVELPQKAKQSPALHVIKFTLPRFTK